MQGGESNSLRQQGQFSGKEAPERSRRDSRRSMPRPGAAPLPPASRPPADEHRSNGEGPNGMHLGRGSWAAAYRKATGPRLDALRLLCACGIVTARELEDDLTVVSDEHIDECIHITTGMLELKPLHEWKCAEQEAKSVFEERLTALYRNRFQDAQ